MDIQRLNESIKWQQLTAKEIRQLKNDGATVPNEYQKWAAAVSAMMEAPDDVTYEMVNGETDIEAINEILGRDDIKAPEDAEEDRKEEGEQEGEESPAFAPSVLEEPKDDVTLADPTLTTDPNEILKRKIRKGMQPEQ